MKIRYLYPLAMGLVLAGCGDDKDSEPPTPPEPPAAVVKHIDEAETIKIKVQSFEPASGALSFSLEDTSGTALTGASHYELMYLGLPAEDKASSNAKAWKRWHVTQGFSCSDIAAECQGVLTEGKTKGLYSFEATGLDWTADAPANSISRYRLAIKVSGLKASSETLYLVAPKS